MNRFVAVLFLVMAGCTSGTPAGETARGPDAAGAPRRLTVFAAASLEDALTSIGEDFRAARPPADPVAITFSFAGSQTLRAQIEQGAPADVFAAADPAPPAALNRAGLAGAPRVIAHNDLVFVRPASTLGAPPGPGVAGLTPEVAAGFARLVVATPEAPLGRYTVELFSRLDPTLRVALEARIVSRELDARQVLGKVLLGEADAAVVYRTDAASAGPRVAVLEPPAGTNVRTALAVSVVSRTAEPALAEAFAAFVAGPAGRARLRAAGFVVDAPVAGAPGGAGPTAVPVP
jgi:molybdate transport system substrate-binding protein